MNCSFKFSGPPFLPFFLGLFFLLHFAHSPSLLSHNSIASPPDRLVFFSSSPHSFLFRRASFWSRLTSPWLFPTSPLSFFFSPSTNFLALFSYSSIFSDSVSISTNSSNSFSTPLITSFPPPISLSSCLTFASHFTSSDRHTLCHKGRGNSQPQCNNLYASRLRSLYSCKPRFTCEDLSGDNPKLLLPTDSNSLAKN